MKHILVSYGSKLQALMESAESIVPPVGINATVNRIIVVAEMTDDYGSREMVLIHPDGMSDWDLSGMLSYAYEHRGER